MGTILKAYVYFEDSSYISVMNDRNHNVFEKFSISFEGLYVLKRLGINYNDSYLSKDKIFFILDKDLIIYIPPSVKKFYWMNYESIFEHFYALVDSSKEIVIVGGEGIEDLSYAFDGMNNWKRLYMKDCHPRHLRNMKNAFSGSEFYKVVMPYCSYSEVTTVDSMFDEASVKLIILGDLDFSSCESMASMFYCAQDLTNINYKNEKLDVLSFKTSKKLVDISYMSYQSGDLECSIGGENFDISVIESFENAFVSFENVYVANMESLEKLFDIVDNFTADMIKYYVKLLDLSQIEAMNLFSSHTNLDFVELSLLCDKQSKK